MLIGRIRRSTYLITSLIILVVTVGFRLFTEVNSDNVQQEGLQTFYYFTISIILLVMTAGRLNDINYSGWFALLALIPIINIAFIALCFIDGDIGDNKYGKDPKGRILKRQSTISENSVKSVEVKTDIEQIDDKLKLLQESLDDDVLDNDEFEQKKNKLLSKRNYLVAKNESETIYNSKSIKLVTLFENGIIDEQELNNKLNRLKKELKIGEYNFEKTNLDALVYFISNSEEIGPVTVEHVIKLLNTNEIDPNCFFRFKNETTYDKRVKDLLK